MNDLAQSQPAVSDCRYGLSPEIAAQRLQLEGRNELTSRKQMSKWVIVIEQFKSSVILLLLAATAISFFMREYLQAIGILAALIINAGIGFAIEYRARASLEALSKMSGATARVRRGGVELELPVQELVRGDIVIIEAGVNIPADIQLLESASLSVDESALTGESVPVWKSAGPAEEGSHEDIVFQGSNVATGRAQGAVIATGARTKLGKLGILLQDTVSGDTPLTRSLNVLGQQVTWLVLALSVIFCIIGLMRHISIDRMLETSIALAVAAIPEGLPIIATLALADGIRKMADAKAIVRKLPAVETLGCTTVICTDKTGTLTENKMLVSNIVVHQAHLQLTGVGYEPSGEISCDGKQLTGSSPLLADFARAIALCNDARLENHGDEDGWHIHGDPTEGALMAAVAKLGFDTSSLMENNPRVAEIPFDLARKRMSTINADPQGSCFVYCKGSPEAVLPLCLTIRTTAGDIALSEDERQWFFAKNNLLAAAGRRVLAVAVRAVAGVPDDLDCAKVEHNLTLLGLVAMSDHPKANVFEATKLCQEAGVRLIMLTGDQAATAQAVAAELGIITEKTPGKVLTGEQLAAMPESEFCDSLNATSVLARVTPEMKLNVIKHLQKQGHIVAMTGDGINDAPALRQSNIGIAMGQRGTDMARQSSDMIITDDNFATIVKAIKQGRVTYANIRRAVGYLLTASLTSVMAISLGLFLNAGLFLEPLQLLFLNLIMHVLPGLGIVLQKEAGDVMAQPPRKASENLLDGFERKEITLRSIIIAAVTLVAMMIDQHYYGPSSGTTVALTTISLALIMQSWSWLSVKSKGNRIRWHENRIMLGCTLLNAIALALSIYFPPMQSVLNTVSLDTGHMLIVTAAALTTYVLSLPLGQIKSGTA